jgi:hypothetical protein
MAFINNNIMLFTVLIIPLLQVVKYCTFIVKKKNSRSLLVQNDIYKSKWPKPIRA